METNHYNYDSFKRSHVYGGNIHALRDYGRHCPYRVVPLWNSRRGFRGMLLDEYGVPKIVGYVGVLP
jgi:hypothetical protein